MDILNQVCTLEQAKKLKELGVAEGAHFCHVRSMLSGDRIGIFPADSIGLLAGDPNIEHAPAFTVAELGVMLPPETKSFDSEAFAAWVVTGQDGKYHYLCATEAEARAAMLIQHLEHGILTAEEVNQHLKSA